VVIFLITSGILKEVYRMNKIVVVTVMLFLGAGLIVSCGKKEDSTEKKTATSLENVKQKASEAVETASEYAKGKKAEYQQKL
jgi:hypothetical protein